MLRVKRRRLSHRWRRRQWKQSRITKRLSRKTIAGCPVAYSWRPATGKSFSGSSAHQTGADHDSGEAAEDECGILARIIACLIDRLTDVHIPDRVGDRAELIRVDSDLAEHVAEAVVAIGMRS